MLFYGLLLYVFIYKFMVLYAAKLDYLLFLYCYDTGHVLYNLGHALGEGMAG